MGNQAGGELRPSGGIAPGAGQGRSEASADPAPRWRRREPPTRPRNRSRRPPPAKLPAGPHHGRGASPRGTPFLAWILALILTLGLAGAGHAETVVVGSKNFEESRLLAEIFARLLEERTDLTVERRLNLAGTRVCFEALRTGAIDLYPEYTGTALVALLDEESEGGAARTLNRVRTEFLDRWNLWWLSPLGFENAYEIAVPRALAERYGLRTLSDLAFVAPELRAGFGFEFIEREDGLPGLARTYGLEFASVAPMQQALKYQAARDGRLDVLDVYTTDGRLVTHDLVILEDDRGFFPPYEAAALVRGEFLDEHPEAGRALALLASALDGPTMQRLNLRLQEGGEEPAAVAEAALVELGLLQGETEDSAEPPPEHPSLFVYLWNKRSEITARTVEHLGLTAAALGLGLLVAVPLGLALTFRPPAWLGGAEGVIRLFGMLQTIPSIALLAFMIPLLGVGWLPAVVALWLYSLFPILRNTYTGLMEADPQAARAALALGMTRSQILTRVRLPLAVPVVLAGVRTAAVLTVGTATLAAFIGAGGLGQPIVTGLQLADTPMILSGALPAALLALAVDGLLALAGRALAPKGLK